MKRNIILAFLLSAFCSCSKDWNGEGMPLMTKGFINLEVVTGLNTDDDSSDNIKKIRFIVLTDLASFPKAEVNEFEEITKDGGISEFNLVLKVSRTESGLNDKIIVAIANEPGSMTPALNKVKTLQDLENLRMEMGEFISADHLSFRTDSLMPMSGTVWTNSSNVKTDEKTAKENPVTLSLDRALAKVEVYLNNSYADKINIAAGSTVKLDSTCTESYFIRHKSGANVLGKIQTVESSALIPKEWTQTADLQEVPKKKADDPSSDVRICTFYTPERYCASDKLRLDVDIKIEGDKGFKSGGITLDMDKNGPIDLVQRNTTYKVTVTIGANDITAIVNGWKSEEIPAEL